MPTFNEIQHTLEAFRDDRDWGRFHSPGHLAAAISVEAAELQELFLWRGLDGQADVVRTRREDVSDELADILICALNFASATGIDPLDAIAAKIAKNATKYPTAKARGSATKYDQR